MSDDRDREELDDEDLGVPVIELNTLTEELPRAGFMHRVRRTIERRRLGSDVAEMSFSGVVVVFFELVRALFGLVKEGSNGKRQGDKR